MPEIDNQDQFVKWFRYSSPYINAHRGKTFVILFDGDTVNDANFANIIHDIAGAGSRSPAPNKRASC